MATVHPILPTHGATIIVLKHEFRDLWISMAINMQLTQVVILLKDRYRMVLIEIMTKITKK